MPLLGHCHGLQVPRAVRHVPRPICIPHLWLVTPVLVLTPSYVSSLHSMPRRTSLLPSLPFSTWTYRTCR